MVLFCPYSKFGVRVSKDIERQVMVGLLGASSEAPFATVGGRSRDGMGTDSVLSNSSIASSRSRRLFNGQWFLVLHGRE